MNRYISHRKAALLAGYSMILMALVAGIGYGYAWGRIWRGGHIITGTHFYSLLSVVITSFLFIILLDIIVAFALHIYFAKVNKNISVIAAWVRVVYALILGIAVVQLFLAGKAFMHADTGRVMQQLELFQDIWSAGLILFSIHLLLIGYLILRVSAIPKVWGVLMLIASIGYFTTNVANLFWPGYEDYRPMADAVLSLPMALGELGVAIWLVVKGRKRAVTSQRPAYAS